MIISVTELHRSATLNGGKGGGSVSWKVMLVVRSYLAQVFSSGRLIVFPFFSCTTATTFCPQVESRAPITATSYKHKDKAFEFYSNVHLWFLSLAPLKDTGHSLENNYCDNVTTLSSLFSFYQTSGMLRLSLCTWDVRVGQQVALHI